MLKKLRIKFIALNMATVAVVLTVVFTTICVVNHRQSVATVDAAGLVRRSARSLREQFAQAMGARITDIAEMNLAVAHLRVPETV